MNDPRTPSLRTGSKRRRGRPACRHVHPLGESDRERALQARLEVIEALVDHPLITLDPCGRILSWNPAAAAVFGTAAEEAIGQSIACFLPDLPSSGFAAESGSGGFPFRCEVTAIRRDGSTFPAEVVGHCGPCGHLPLRMVAVTDLTARRAAETEIGRLTHEHEVLLVSTSYAILRVEPGGTIGFANPPAIELLGRGISDLVGVPLGDVLRGTGRDAERLEDIVASALLGNPARVEADLVLEGRPILISARAEPLRNGDGAVLVLEDCTHRRRLEEELRQAQKMEVLGQLAGGIAHDFNNELAVITLNAFMVRSDIAAGRIPDGEMVAEIHGAAERATRVSRQLLDMSRRSTLDVRSMELGPALRQVGRLLTKLVPETIDVRVEAAETGYTARVDAGALEQALLNLGTNARDAMPEGGCLTVRLSSERIGPDHRPSAAIGTRPEPGRYQLAEVIDTGVGIPATMLSHVVEPFFTTKEKGRGTGLGLSMVYGLVRQMDGFLDIESTPGEGTAVRLYFPADGSAPEEAAPPPHSEWEGDGEGRVVLVVEDEDPVRRACVTTLQRKGFEVLEAENGEVALEVFEAALGRVDAVVSDSVMPVLTGVELYRRLAELYGPIPFVLMTGYSDRIPEDLSGLPVLQKPWNPTDFLSTVWGEIRRLDPSIPGR